MPLTHDFDAGVYGGNCTSRFARKALSNQLVSGVSRTVIRSCQRKRPMDGHSDLFRHCHHPCDSHTGSSAGMTGEGLAGVLAVFGRRCRSALARGAGGAYNNPMLDFDTCNAARCRRDPAYDGVFFTAVRTTGIYCRPVCPVRQPLDKNVTFYPSAAAAERAGYRPCLRCRPETAPFSPAWNGTAATVRRALKLIEAGALDSAGVDHLAGRLGIGARHLSRLFQRHVGASPLQTAQTCRLQRAKRLLDGTDFSVSEIALKAGFKSRRRFNAAFSAVFAMAPSQYRRGRTKRP